MNTRDLLDKMPYTKHAQVVFDKIIKSGKFVVKYDPDVDGMFSGLFMQKYIEYKYGLTVPVSVNMNRGHGPLDMQMLPTAHSPLSTLVDIPKGYGIINVDSSISEDRLQELVIQGHDVLSLDHHELEFSQDSKDKEHIIIAQSDANIGMVLNNQYWCMPEEYKFQSGSGVVLSFINGIDSEYPDTHNFIAMNGITLLSDTRPIEGPIAHKILHQLYITPPNANEIISHITQTIGFNKYSYGPDMLDRVYIDFMLSPFVNALLRFDKGYETISWLNGGSLSFAEPRKKQQDVIAQLREQVNLQVLDNLAIVTLEQDDTLGYSESNFIGYFANRVVNETGKTTVIAISDKGKFTRGSVRGLRSSVDYRTAFSKMGMIALGHKGAFGLKSFNTDPNFWPQADKYIGMLEQSTTEEFEVKNSNSISTDRDVLKQIADNNQYKRGPNKTYIKYTGMSIKTQKIGAKLVEFLVDGLLVKTFDVDLTPSDADVYIDPTLDKGYLKLYLVRLTK